MSEFAKLTLDIESDAPPTECDVALVELADALNALHALSIEAPMGVFMAASKRAEAAQRRFRELGGQRRFLPVVGE